MSPIPATTVSVSTAVTTGAVSFSSLNNVADTQFVSSTELRVLLPAGLLRFPGLLILHIESGQDGDLSSDSPAIQIVPATGATAPPPPAPVVSFVDPPHVPYVPDGQDFVEVNVLGDNFDSGAVVHASFDGKEPQALQTTVVSKQQARAKILRKDYRKSKYTFKVNVYAKAYQKPLSAIVSHLVSQPTIRFVHRGSPKDYINPARFSIDSGWMPNPTSAG